MPCQLLLPSNDITANVVIYRSMMWDSSMHKCAVVFEV